MAGQFSWTKLATCRQKSKSRCCGCCKNVKSSASAIAGRFRWTCGWSRPRIAILNALLAEGKFRADLLYRLNVVPIEMPSLRERAGDIPLLVEYFTDRFGKRAGKKFKAIDKKSLKLFEAYGWPGNVPELQNGIERAVTLRKGAKV